MKTRLIIFILTVISIVSLVTNGFLSKNISDIQGQVYVRDSLIKVKTERELKSKEETNELLKSLSSLFENSTLTEDGKFDVKSFIKMHQGLKDSIHALQRSLDLIKKNYGIYTVTKVISENEKQVITSTQIKGGERIDSALLLLPRFRDRLEKVNNKVWTIDKAGKDLKKITEQYNREIDDYNELNKKYIALAEKHNADIKFYREMLVKMSKKGLIKIDTVDGGYKYIY